MNGPSSHCWHQEGGGTTTLAMFNNVMTSTVVCCNCGERGTLHTREQHGPVPGHGPHFQATIYVNDPIEYDVPCAGVDSTGRPWPLPDMKDPETRERIIANLGG